MAERKEFKVEPIELEIKRREEIFFIYKGEEKFYREAFLTIQKDLYFEKGNVWNYRIEPDPKERGLFFWLYYQEPKDLFKLGMLVERSKHAYFNLNKREEKE